MFAAFSAAISVGFVLAIAGPGLLQVVGVALLLIGLFGPLAVPRRVRSLAPIETPRHSGPRVALRQAPYPVLGAPLTLDERDELHSEIDRLNTELRRLRERIGDGTT